MIFYKWKSQFLVCIFTGSIFVHKKCNKKRYFKLRFLNYKILMAKSEKFVPYKRTNLHAEKAPETASKDIKKHVC